MFTSTLSTHFLHLHHWRQLCEQHPFKMLICFTDQITFWYTPKSQWFIYCTRRCPSIFRPCVVRSRQPRWQSSPSRPSPPPGTGWRSRCATCFDLISHLLEPVNSHLLALDILRSLFCLSGRRRDGSPLPQLPTGWLYEHRQAPGDLCFLYSWKAGEECWSSLFRKWNLTRPLLSTLDRCHCGIKLNVDEVFFLQK